MSRVEPTSSSFPSGDTPRKVIILSGITSVIVALILLESRMMFGEAPMVPGYLVEVGNKPTPPLAVLL